MWTRLSPRTRVLAPRRTAGLALGIEMSPTRKCEQRYCGAARQDWAYLLGSRIPPSIYEVEMTNLNWLPLSSRAHQ